MASRDHAPSTRGPKMSEMIERVAKAIRSELLRQGVLYESPELGANDLMFACEGDVADLGSVVRATIEAMREPTEAMFEAGWDATDIASHPDQHPDDVDNPAVCWSAMIDAALGPQVES